MARVYNLPQRKSFIGGLSINLIFIIINMSFFILAIILLSSGILQIDHIALKPSNILEGKYIWTFLTSMFMHSPTTFFHIFANMISLIFIGGFIEKLIGRKRYFWFYMVAGLFAGIFYVLIEPSGPFAVGASGAIFGVAGLMAVLTPNLPLYVMFIPIPIKAKYAIPGLLIVLWLISATGGIPIGNTAHLGGLITGLAYGAYIRYKFPNKTRILSRHFS